MHNTVAAKLFRKARKGDEQASAELFATTRRVLVAFFRRKGAGSHTAEDLASEVILKIWKHRRRFSRRGHDERCNYFGWVFRIADRTYIDHCIKKPSRRPVTVELTDAEDNAPAPPDILEHREQMEPLYASMEKLLQPQRAALTLMVHGLNGDEICSETGYPAWRVKYLLRSAKNSMRMMLGVPGSVECDDE